MYQVVHFKHVQFIVCPLCLNKADTNDTLVGPVKGLKVSPLRSPVPQVQCIQNVTPLLTDFRFALAPNISLLGGVTAIQEPRTQKPENHPGLELLSAAAGGNQVW